MTLVGAITIRRDEAAWKASLESGTRYVPAVVAAETVDVPKEVVLGMMALAARDAQKSETSWRQFDEAIRCAEAAGLINTKLVENDDGTT